MSLEAFGKSCGVFNIEKSCFPYEHFKGPEELKQCYNFPRYKHFRTVLSRTNKAFLTEFAAINQRKISENNWTLDQIREFYDLDDMAGLKILNGLLVLEEGNNLLKQLHTSPEKYEESLKEFELNCSTMLDFLERYNIRDCELLRESIARYSAGFLEDWNVNIHDSMSLPGFAEKMCYEFYDVKSPAIFTFGKSFNGLNKEVRKNLHGGMTMVLHRHISLGPVEIDKPKEVFYADNGERYQRVESLGKY